MHRMDDPDTPNCHAPSVRVAVGLIRGAVGGNNRGLEDRLRSADGASTSDVSPESSRRDKKKRGRRRDKASKELEPLPSIVSWEDVESIAFRDERVLKIVGAEKTSLPNVLSGSARDQFAAPSSPPLTRHQCLSSKYRRPRGPTGRGAAHSRRGHQARRSDSLQVPVVPAEVRRTPAPTLTLTFEARQQLRTDRAGALRSPETGKVELFTLESSRTPFYTVHTTDVGYKICVLVVRARFSR